MPRKAGIFGREVGPEMHAAALGACERALGDEAGKEMRRAPQALEPSGFADEAGVPPQRLSRGGRGRRFGLGRWRKGWRQVGFLERGQGGPATEDEALEAHSPAA